MKFFAMLVMYGSSTEAKSFGDLRPVTAEALEPIPQTNNHGTNGLLELPLTTAPWMHPPAAISLQVASTRPLLVPCISTQSTLRSTLTLMHPLNVPGYHRSL